MIIAYCIKCGNKFPQEAMFCPYCGTKVYRPEEESFTAPQVHKEDKLESTVIEEPTILNKELKDFHERLTEVVASKVENVEEPSVQEIINEPSPEPAQQNAEPVPVSESALDPEANDPQHTYPALDKVAQESPQETEEEEGPSTGGCIIAFFFPMIGFISALCNIGSNKKKAKRYALLAALGLLVGFISGVIQAL